MTVTEASSNTEMGYHLGEGSEVPVPFQTETAVIHVTLYEPYKVIIKLQALHEQSIKYTHGCLADHTLSARTNVYK